MLTGHQLPVKHLAMGMQGQVRGTQLSIVDLCGNKKSRTEFMPSEETCAEGQGRHERRSRAQVSMARAEPAHDQEALELRIAAAPAVVGALAPATQEGILSSTEMSAARPEARRSSSGELATFQCQQELTLAALSLGQGGASTGNVDEIVGMQSESGGLLAVAQTAPPGRGHLPSLDKSQGNQSTAVPATPQEVDALRALVAKHDAALEALGQLNAAMVSICLAGAFDGMP